jgi:hypothetical protein
VRITAHDAQAQITQKQNVSAPLHLWFLASSHLLGSKSRASNHGLGLRHVHSFAAKYRIVEENDMGLEKAWAKAGKIGDPLIIQILFKKQVSFARAHQPESCHKFATLSEK